MHAGTLRYVLLLTVLLPALAQGQHSYVFRGVPLAEALERVARETGLPVAYDSEIAEGRTTFCAIENEPAERVLRCVLAGTGLDFVRLSSGTYVLTLASEMRPLYGALSGIVVDARTGEPLPNAHVLVAGAGLGTVTNAAGLFTFADLLPGQYPIAVSHLAYEAWSDTLSVKAGSTTRTDAPLSERALVAAPVIVDAVQARPTLATVSMPRLTGRPAAVFAGLPGVRLNEETDQVFLQGGAPGTHALRLDGAPLLLPRRPAGFASPFGTFGLKQATVHGAGFGADIGSQTSGVLELTSHTGAQTRFDLDVSEVDLEGRFQARSSEQDDASFSASGRYSAPASWRPAPLAQQLDRWTAPDPFLLFGPLRQYDLARNETFEALALRSIAEPDLNFGDLHLATRLRPRPLHTFDASLYVGRHEISGSLLPNEPEALEANNFDRVLLSVDEAQQTRTLTGQARYEAVLNARTLLTVQARRSQYGMDQAYTLLDTLTFALVRPIDDTGGETQLIEVDYSKLSTRELEFVEDRNRASETGLSIQIEHARGRHDIGLGVEAVQASGSFDLLTASPTTAETFENVPRLGRSFGIRQGRIAYDEAGIRLAAHLTDRMQLSNWLTADGGVRFTYVPSRQTVYAEPRLALRTDHEGRLGRLTTRTAAGVYRQFVNETDVSVFNAGSLLPAVRVWLPIDGSVRPPLALHVAETLIWHPSQATAFRLEMYYKHLPHSLALAPGLPTLQTKQADFLTRASGYAYGGTVTASTAQASWQARLAYTYGRARQRQAGRFNDRLLPAPWDEPHRLEGTVAWTPLSGLTLDARGEGIWGRTWAFRQTYYDYLAGFAPFAGFDFAAPDEHERPAHLALDLGTSYARRFGPVTAALRLDLLNALDHTNVADYRLLFDGTDLAPTPRAFHSRTWLLTLRLSR